LGKQLARLVAVKLKDFKREVQALAQPAAETKPLPEVSP